MRLCDYVDYIDYVDYVTSFIQMLWASEGHKSVNQWFKGSVHTGEGEAARVPINYRVKV